MTVFMCICMRYKETELNKKMMQNTPVNWFCKGIWWPFYSISCCCIYIYNIIIIIWWYICWSCLVIIYNIKYILQYIFFLFIFVLFHFMLLLCINCIDYINIPHKYTIVFDVRLDLWYHLLHDECFDIGVLYYYISRFNVR